MGANPRQPFNPSMWATPEDGPELASVRALLSVTLGTCRICAWKPGEGGETLEYHLEQHRWEASPEGQREYRRLTAVLCQDGPVTLRRRLGRPLWKLRDQGESAAQIARDVRVPLAVVEYALTVPSGQRAGVLHLHRLGLLSTEIAERLELPHAAVERNLRGADWALWLERCCPPGWASKPLL